MMTMTVKFSTHEKRTTSIMLVKIENSLQQTASFTALATAVGS